MPSERDLSIGYGIASGLDKMTNNLLSVMQARQKLKQDAEKNSLDLKIKKLQLQKAEDDLSPEMLAMEKEKLNLENKFNKAKTDYYSMKAKEAENKYRKGINLALNAGAVTLADAYGDKADSVLQKFWGAKKYVKPNIGVFDIKAGDPEFENPFLENLKGGISKETYAKKYYGLLDQTELPKKGGFLDDDKKTEPVLKGSAKKRSFKTGEIRIKDGQKYERQKDGTWLPI